LSLTLNHVSININGFSSTLWSKYVINVARLYRV
jgi:hypothetical protein